MVSDNLVQQSRKRGLNSPNTPNKRSNTENDAIKSPTGDPPRNGDSSPAYKHYNPYIITQTPQVKRVVQARIMTLTRAQRVVESFENSSRKLKQVPCFRPSIEEFRNPTEYIDKVSKEAVKYGMAKIIPPEPISELSLNLEVSSFINVFANQKIALTMAV